MANVITQDDLGKSNLGNKNQQPGVGQTNAPGTPAFKPGSPSQPGGAPLTPAQKQGSGFTNINRVMQANQGNKLGQTVGSGVQQQGQQVQNQLGQAQQQFGKQSQANRLDTIQNQQLFQQGLQDPTKLAADQSNISKFQNILSGKYQGPQGLQNADQLAAQAASAQQMGQALGSEGGRQSLLQRFVGGNQYGQGQQTLDAMLLGAGPQQALNQAKQSVSGVGAQTQSGIEAAQAQAQQLGARAQQFGQGAQQQFTQNVNQQVQGLQQQARAAQTARDKQVQALMAGLQSGTISADDAAKLGLTAGQQVYNTFKDPSQFIQESAIKANAQNIASAQDYARMQALQKLAGTYTPAQAQQQLGQFAGQQGQAGAFQAAGPYTADTAGIQQSIANQAQAYQDVMNPIIQQQNQLYWERQGIGQNQIGPVSTGGFGGSAATQVGNQMAALRQQAQQ